jgi:hypothetical protein
MAKGYQTNSMPTVKGIYPGLNEYGQISNLAWTPRVVAKTTAYTVKSSESGTFFTTTGATAAVNFTLPAIGDGPYWFMFICGADIGMTVTSVVADTIVTFNDLAADSVAFSQASEMIGGSIEVICDGTTLFALARLASEAQTIVIATA